MEELEESLQEVSVESLGESIEMLQEKLSIFIEETVPDFTTRDLLSRILESHLEVISSHVCGYIEQKEMLSSDCQCRIEMLEQEARELEEKV